MIALETAISIAQQKIDSIGKRSNLSLGLLLQETIEFEFGWMFFYQSSKFIETKDLNFLVGGNAPIIVDKFNSSVHITGTRMDEDFYIKLYIKHRLNIQKFYAERVSS